MYSDHLTAEWARNLPAELPTDPGAEYAGKGGRRVRWRVVGDDCVRIDGYVDFEKALGKDNSGATTFGATTFQATHAGKARLYVGSGDALTIWLNGQTRIRQAGTSGRRA